MNQLILHIEYLLLHYECVIVPGLGAFIVISSPAKIMLEEGCIIPPSRSVMFNQAVTTDDGLLTNSIARKNNITFEEARQFLFKEVASLKQHLLSYGNFAMGKIGTFLTGEDNTILFTPAITADALSVNPGLETIHFTSPTLRKHTKEVNSTEIYVSENLNRAVSVKKSWFREIVKIAAAVAIVAAIAVAGLIYPLPSDSREQKASVVPVDALFPKKEIIKTDSTQISLPPSQIAESTAAFNKEEKNSLPLYYLIVATFKNKTDAEAYVAQFSTSELKLSIIASNKVTRVSVASSSNRKDLQSLLNSPKISSRFSNPWIWTKN